MDLVCLDLEGVLVPEIWIAFADAVGVPELRRTTRDEPDYDKLMAYRLAILKERGLGLSEITAVIAGIDPEKNPYPPVYENSEKIEYAEASFFA